MIFIVWRGWGPIGLGFLAAGFLLWVGLVALYRGAFDVAATQGWWNIVGLVLGFGAGALANWLFAVKVVEPRFDRVNELQPATSMLFFLPLRHWTFAILAIGLMFLVPNVLDQVR